MITDELQIFLADKHSRNAWLAGKYNAIYVRKAMRHIQLQNFTSLDIAAVETDEEFQGKGLFKMFLTEVIKYSPYQIIYVENVNNPVFAKYFYKNDWYVDPNCVEDISPCFYLPIENLRSSYLETQKV
jgi:GNAT superfamily N-acetyltransferase